MKKFLIAAIIFLPLLFINNCSSYFREIAYANFSDLNEDSIDTDGYNINGSGWDSKPEFNNALRLIDKGSYVSLQFYVNDVPENAVLSVEHASAALSACSNGGYSPVTIKINNISVVSNFSPASSRYTTKKWNVTNLLKSGENEISWTACNLCSSYLLRSWSIFDNPRYYYHANYNNWYGSYYVKPRYYLHWQKPYRIYNQPRIIVPKKSYREQYNPPKIYPFNQSRNDQNYKQRKNDYNQNRYKPNYQQKQNRPHEQQRQNEHRNKHDKQNHGKR